MRLVIQRVTGGEGNGGGEVIGSISKGLLVLIGISGEDTRETADRYLKN